MRYMLLIYDREADWAALKEADRGAMYEEYGAFTSWSLLGQFGYEPVLLHDGAADGTTSSSPRIRRRRREGSRLC